MEQSSPAPFSFGSGVGDAGVKEGFNFEFSAGAAPTFAPDATETWVRNQFQTTYCKTGGKPTAPFDASFFRKSLEKRRPGEASKIAEVVDKLDIEMSDCVCKGFPYDENAFTRYKATYNKMAKMRPDVTKNGMLDQTIKGIEKSLLTTTRTERQYTPEDETSSEEETFSQDGLSSPEGPPSPDAEWIIDQSEDRYCPPSTGRTSSLRNERPGAHDVIAGAVKEMEMNTDESKLSDEDHARLLKLAQEECGKLSWYDGVRSQNRSTVIQSLWKHHPHARKGDLKKILMKAERDLAGNSVDRPTIETPTNMATAQPILAKPAANSSETELKAWVYQQYLDHGFSRSGFKGFAKLKGHVTNQIPVKKVRNRALEVVESLRRADSTSRYSFGEPNEFFKTLTERRLQAQTLQENPSPPPIAAAASRTHQTVAEVSTTRNDLTPPISHKPPMPDLLEKKLGQLRIAQKYHRDQDHDSGVDVPSPAYEDEAGADESSDESDNLSEDDSFHESDASDEDLAHDETSQGGRSGEDAEHEVDCGGMSDLLSDDSDNDEEDEWTNVFDNEIRHAPLIVGDMIDSEKHLLPQYGLMGSHKELDTKSKLFLNTNTPLSAFVCGVQGSGKSHTTSCILENSLIPSKKLGHLESPLSALVFCYGQFSGDGSGYSISEAAFLACPSPQFPNGAHVKRVNVLVAPSNFIRISKLYLRIPNVRVTKFMLKPWKLDIDIMLTLMNVSESDKQPLYMAQVTQILREMATSGAIFDYAVFRQRLQQQKFDPVQTNMLQMRLNLLESFLDMKNTCPEAEFKPGEITIMDMSCPFVDANTACILFRIGLTRYLQSKATGKMIVLDEAHKYMVDVPGAKALNESLLQTIRLQRHFGARVVISTQEPTLLTDLIALCSITVIHRFSSPEWFTAIKRHIPIDGKDRDDLMRTIEGLKTGTALVYAPNAVLGWKNAAGEGSKDKGNGKNGLVKGVGRMLKVSMRKRITSDGGQSVLAV